MTPNGPRLLEVNADGVDLPRGRVGYDEALGLRRLPGLLRREAGVQRDRHHRDTA